MLKLLFRRIFLGGLTVIIVSMIIFGAVEMLPGDACTALLQQDARGETLKLCQEDLGLNRPAAIRYTEWVGSAAKGDFGLTAHRNKKVSDLVGDRVKNSLLLGLCSLALGLPLAFAMGTIPEFVSATVLILIFSAWLGWLPGIVTASASSPLSAFFPEIILPVVVLSMVMTAHILRTVRSSMLEVLDSDYVRMATLKGVPYSRMIVRHVLPNALLPAINVVALTVAWLLGGVVVIETVFNYPGLGRLMVSAISDRDLGLVQAIALIVSCVYVIVNLSADILSLLANPRLRTSMGRNS
jgi:peptide/nickel transport system permease protein